MNILEEYAEPSFGERFGNAFANLGRTAGSAIPAYMQQQQDITQKEAELADLHKMLGLGKSNIRNPEMLKLMMQEQFKEKENERERQNKLLMEEGKKKHPFEESLMKKGAATYEGLQQSNLQLQDALGEVNRIERMIDQLSGTGGYKYLIPGTKEAQIASDLRASSQTVVQPILKILNPAGAMAMQKFKAIMDTHAIEPSDTTAKAKGKANAVRNFMSKALERNNYLMQLLYDHEGVIPPEEFAKYSSMVANDLNEFESEMKGAESSTNSKPKEKRSLDSII